MIQAYLFSNDREIIAFCNDFTGYDVRISVYDRIRKDLFRPRSAEPSWILLDDEVLSSSGLGTDNPLLQEIIEDYPVIIISREESPYVAINYIRTGFAGYIHYPCSLQFLWRKIQILCEQHGKHRKSYRFGKSSEKKVAEEPLGEISSFIGESDVVKRMKHDLVRFAQSEFPVFLYGETGTGKNLLATEIWKNSLRSKRPFLWENLGALPSGLAVSTLFGTRKGTFTGAENIPGLFESAQHGTVFLDEVECASPEIQQALLCISDDMECKRVSSHKVIKPDVRIISASNVNLKKLVEDGRFREDLFFRLTWLPIRIPSLREHMDDLPVLVDSILKKSGKTITENAMKKLAGYSWPGNVRELFSCINRASVLCTGAVVDMSDIHIASDFGYDPSGAAEKRRS